MIFCMAATSGSESRSISSVLLGGAASLLCAGSVSPLATGSDLGSLSAACRRPRGPVGGLLPGSGLCRPFVG